MVNIPSLNRMIRSQCSQKILEIAIQMKISEKYFENLITTPTIVDLAHYEVYEI